MNARIESEPGPVKNRTTVERKSDREVVVTRTINGPARIVFEAFTKAELLKRWWVPKSMGMTLLSCEVDARVGGKYRLVDRKSTRLNSSHLVISYAVFCLKKKKKKCS